MSASEFTTRHEGDLRWKFGCHQNSPIFERSTTGEMLDRLENFGHHEDGRRVESRSVVENRRWEFNQRRCERELTVLSYDDFAMMRAGIDALELDEDPSLTVDIVHESRTVSIITSDEVYIRNAHISRALDRCTSLQRAALERYFGLMGNRWLRHKLGRLLALYELTETGQTILGDRFRRCQRDKTADEGGPSERIADEWRHQRKWKDELRARKFRRAEFEARALLAEAKTAYAAGWGR